MGVANIKQCIKLMILFRQNLTVD